MNSFIGLTKRNLLIYFKDVAAIFFSMLTPVIVFVLYILFLKGTFVDALEGEAEMLKGLLDAKDLDSIANGLLLAGVMGSALITVPYSTLTTIINDREKKVDYDISATPMSRVQIILSYFAASALSAFIMTTIIMTAGLIILCCNFNMYLGISDVLKLLGINFLGSVCSTAVFMLIVIFIKKSSTSTAFFGLLSAASGFVIGAYIPLHQFSEKIQTICNVFPQTGITSLIRNVLLSGVLDHIDGDLNGIDDGMFVKAVRESFSLSMRLFEKDCSASNTLIYVTMFTVVVLVALGVIYPKVYKRR